MIICRYFGLREKLIKVGVAIARQSNLLWTSKPHGSISGVKTIAIDKHEYVCIHKISIFYNHILYHVIVEYRYFGLSNKLIKVGVALSRQGDLLWTSKPRESISGVKNCNHRHP